MISLVLTNRNRDLRIVKNCLDSLMLQSNHDFEIIFVDYGSEEKYFIDLEKLLFDYSNIKLIKCLSQVQLWNKSRAINIALRQTTKAYLLVGDVDMIYRNDFIEKAISLSHKHQIVYFKIGFLDEEESDKNISFREYKVKHYSSSEATGITLFPTHLVKTVHGYDEFYHGWGAEDTDVHERFKCLGQNIYFYEEEVLLLHQWHRKQYRSKSSSQPFHSDLERINHQYMMAGKRTNRTIVNLRHQWGVVPDQERYFQVIKQSSNVLEISNSKNAVKAILFQFQNFEDEVFTFEIKKASKTITFKNKLKQLLRKKHIVYLEMEEVNNMILEEIIKNYRNNPYSYSFDRQTNCIKIKMFFL